MAEILEQIRILKELFRQSEDYYAKMKYLDDIHHRQIFLRMSLQKQSQADKTAH